MPSLVIGAVAVCGGLGAAWWLGPQPEPEDPVPVADVRQEAPPTSPSAPPAPPAGDAAGDAVEPARRRGPDAATLRAMSTPSPQQEAQPPPATRAARAWQTRLQQPDAVWFGEAAAGWRAVQRELGRGDADPGLQADVADLVEGLRRARRGPDRVNADALRHRSDALLDRVSASSDDDDLASLTDALDARTATFEAARIAQP